jgi:hypothetical protein
MTVDGPNVLPNSDMIFDNRRIFPNNVELFKAHYTLDGQFLNITFFPLVRELNSQLEFQFVSDIMPGLF